MAIIYRPKFIFLQRFSFLPCLQIVILRNELLKNVLRDMVDLEPVYVGLLLDLTVDDLQWLLTILIDHTLDSWLRQYLPNLLTE